MTSGNVDQGTRVALDAVYFLMGDEELQNRLAEKGTAQEALAKLRLSEADRPALLNIINRLRHRAADEAPALPLPESSGAVTPGSGEMSRSQTRQMLMESFTYIRWSFWISLLMSVALFIVGLVLLGIAVWRSLSETDVSTATLTIAGLSVADFVLLFYTRPWQDIAANLSNSQQVKIIAVSYLSGLSLVKEGNKDTIQQLEQLTRTSVSLLEEFTERHTSDDKVPPKGPKLDSLHRDAAVSPEAG